MQRNHLAKAYYHKGEPEFEKLCILFGFGDVKNERDNSVIVLSDTTYAPSELKNLPQGIDDDEEVTSPIPISSRRRLFESEAMEMDPDQESTNIVGARRPPRNAFPLPFKGFSSKAKKNLSSSSCASSSPTPRR